MWFWFCVTPEESHVTPGGKFTPSLGTTAIDYAYKAYIYTLFDTFSNQPLWELHEIVKKITPKWMHCQKVFFLKRFMRESSVKPLKSRVRHFFCTDLRHNNSPGDWARELFKSSKDVESLVVSIFKKVESFGFQFFVGDVIIVVGLGFFDNVIRPWAPTARGSFCFSLLK